MSSLEDAMIEDEIRESWWKQGEAVMKEMCDEEIKESKDRSI